MPVVRAHSDADTPPRLAPLPPQQWPPTLAAILDATHTDGDGRVNLFGTLAHHPALAHGWLGLAYVLTHDSALAHRDRELTILRTAHRHGAAYVWDRHAVHARQAGLTAADIDATRRPLPDHPWVCADLTLLEATDELLDHGDLGNHRWQRLSALLRPDQVVEFLMLVGQSMSLCLLLKTLRTPSDDRRPRPIPQTRDEVPL